MVEKRYAGQNKTQRDLNALIDEVAGVQAELSALDHGTLGGLGDDDHAQYYNAARHTLGVHTDLGLVSASRAQILADYNTSVTATTITAQWHAINGWRVDFTLEVESKVLVSWWTCSLPGGTNTFEPRIDGSGFTTTRDIRNYQVVSTLAAGDHYADVRIYRNPPSSPDSMGPCGITIVALPT